MAEVMVAGLRAVSNSVIGAVVSAGVRMEGIISDIYVTDKGTK
jgi:hypothetical protein